MAWNATKSCDPGSLVEITFRGNVSVKINSQTVLDIPSPARKILRIATGLLSVQGSTLTLRSRAVQPTVITTVGTFDTVMLKFDCNGRSEEVSYQNVKAMSIGANQINLDCPREEVPDPVNHTTPVTAATISAAEYAVLKNQLAAVKAELAAAQANTTRSDRRILALEQREKALMAENQALSQAVQNGIEQLITECRSAESAASGQLQTALTELETARKKQSDTEAELSRVRAEVEAATGRLQQLQQELAALNSQQEVTDLDCEKATRELEALRIRLQMNGDTVALTESRWLKNNSVGDTLKELAKKMKAVEDRIGFILNARELYGRAVQDAVLRDGDGTIPLQSESGNPRAATPAGSEEEVTGNHQNNDNSDDAT